MASLLRCECCGFEGESEIDITCAVGHECQRNDLNCIMRNRNLVRRSFCSCCGKEFHGIGEQCGYHHECKEGKCDNYQYFRVPLRKALLDCGCVSVNQQQITLPNAVIERIAQKRLTRDTGVQGRQSRRGRGANPWRTAT
jgi:hypothetical protein